MKTKNKIRTLLTVAFLSGALSLVQAQGPGGPGPDPDPPPTNVPLDGGLSLLIAAGIGYAAKKGYDNRKKATKMDEQQESNEL